MQVGRSLEVHLAAGMLGLFSPLLQAGIEVEVEAGCSIRQLLTEQLGVAAGYITERISTIFLDSRAVDNPDSALLRDGAVLALSGAMPGLVGATMRSGGYYAAMRGAMTYRDEARVPAASRGVIRIKLFNLLLEELGPRLLRRGILLTADRWRDFLAQLPQGLRARGYWIDEEPAPPERLRCGGDFPDGGETLRLRVRFGDG